MTGEALLSASAATLQFSRYFEVLLGIPGDSRRVPIGWGSAGGGISGGYFQLLGPGRPAWHGEEFLPVMDEFTFPPIFSPTFIVTCIRDNCHSG